MAGFEQVGCGVKIWLIALGLLSISRAAMAQDVDRTQFSNDALQLARALVPPISEARLTSLADGLAVQIRNTHLAYRGQGCDQHVAACRAAADEVARDAAPAIAEQQREARARSVAIIFSSQMSEADIRSSLGFLKSSSGQKFATAVAASNDFRSLPQAAQLRLTEQMLTPSASAISISTLAERFYDRTRGLPRGPALLAPPAPFMPSKPKSVGHLP
ncbi:hypothetical protein [uncultured Sphingomonas sp.]|uniref:hypothetical protein n=1 Tax=uncultured Sphingomonas sp. TaxID=158754 RepID=UPI0035CB290A